jgi:hypothetical protein
MSGPRYDLVPEVLPEATPWPREPEPEPAAAQHGYPTNVGSLVRPGKILFSAVIAFLAGLLAAACAAPFVH